MCKKKPKNCSSQLPKKIMWSKVTYGIILVLIVFQTRNTLSLSDKRLCADQKCQETISIGKTKVTYSADEKGKVSFRIHSPVRIKSKSAGRDQSLWGIEVNGRSGYAPKEFIQEEKILIKDKDIKFEVPVENFEEPVKKAIDVPSVKLNPSEVVTEEKVQPTAIPATVPLDSETKAPPSMLNASETEVESTTTAPLIVKESEIVNQSLREMITPVISNFEVIDGTTIPIVGNEPSNINAGTGNEINEAATTKIDTEPITTPSLEENSQASNDAKADEHLKENELKNDETTAAKTSAAKQEHEGSTTVEKSEKQLEEVNDGSISTILEEKVANAQVNTSNIEVENIKVNPSESVETPTEATTTTAQNKVANEASNVYLELNQSNISENSIEAKSEDLLNPIAVEKDKSLKEEVQVGTDEKTQETLTNTPSATVQPDVSSLNVVKTKILQEAVGIQNQNMDANEKGTFGDPYLTGDMDDDDDDDGVNDDEDEDDKENYHIPSASAELTTPKTSQEVTDSGYETLPNRNYWQDEEEMVTTTPAPKLVVEHRTDAIAKSIQAEEMKPTEESAENNNKLTSTTIPAAFEEAAEQQSTKTVDYTPTSSETSSENTETTTAIPENVVEYAQQPSSEAIESTTLKPQVPSIPTTLPIFQQPTLPPIKQQEHQNTHHATYDNPNDYYRQQNLKLQEENIPETKPMEALPSYSTQHTTESTTSVKNDYTNEVPEHHTQRNEDFSNTGKGSVEMIPPVTPLEEQHTEIPEYMPKEEKREAGLFTTILGTVNTVVSKFRKEQPKTSHEVGVEDEELQNILYPGRLESNKDTHQGEQFCEKLSPHQCPQQQHTSSSSSNTFENQQCHYDWSHINMDNFGEVFLAKAFEMREFLCCLTIAASSILLFLFGYYCFCNSSQEGALISKLNQLERSLLASHKENAILKDDLLKTRSKLISIEDNSFGSNDMVIALNKDLETLSAEKYQLQEHVHSLEKELEAAAEAGLELNKIVAELLNNQSGQESMIMNSVEDLQLQFNEQQKTIMEINANLAEKSRENSELQLMLAEQNVRFSGEIASLQQDNDELEAEKSNLQTRIEELKTEFEEDIAKALEGKNVEIKRLQNDIMELRNRFEDVHTKWQTSLAKIEALEDCMKTMKKDPSVNISDVIKTVNVKAELLDLQKQRASLKSLLDTETEARQHAESSLKNTISEVDRLKQDFHQSEKDKLEAQTRLEVLSNYFKEKETQLQKELSLKEAIWLKQQGENTSTVDRMTAMQEEIQSLKSQNDALRAEIEAQIAAHKAQTGTLENRAHETWLAARQSERRYEEARAEAAALRRRLTEMAGSTNSGDPNRTGIDNKITSVELTNAPSPIMPPPLMDTAGSPLLGRLPPPQFMPFMGPPPPPFLNLPPPPFLSSVEMRPAPLGRMMSPPLGRYSPAAQRERDRSDYYDDDYSDDEDEDYEDDDYDYDDEPRRRRRRSGNGSDSWRRDNYSPPPPDRSYRSHSPADSRYNYTADGDLVSTYETDLSPPASPPERGGFVNVHSRRGNSNAYSPHTTSSATKESTTAAKKSNKAVPNSDSDKSYSSTRLKKKGKSMV